MNAVNFIPIRLIGVGTPEVESASSYVLRLASAHGLSVSQIVEVLFEVLRKDNELNYVNPVVGAPSRLSTFCRPTSITYQFNFTVKRYLGETNIDKSCVIPICPGMPDMPWFFVGSTCWCPLCLKEDIEAGSEPYLRLKWQSGRSRVCLRHWVLLIGGCSHCRESQDITRHFRTVTTCFKCGRSLLDLVIPCDHSILTNADWDVHDFVELYSSGYTFSWETIFSALVEVMKKEFGGIEGVLEWEKKTYRTIKFSQYLSTPNNIPGLYKLMQFGQLTGVPLLGLLTGQPYPIQRPLMFKSENHLNRVGLVRRRDLSHDHKAIYKQVVSLVRDHNPPLSVREIAKKLHVSPGYIEYRWPNLVETTVKRAGAFREQKKWRDTIEAENLVSEYLTQCIRENTTYSAHKAARILSKQSGISRPRLERAAKRALTRHLE